MKLDKWDKRFLIWFFGCVVGVFIHLIVEYIVGGR